VIKLPIPFRRRLSRRLVRAARDPERTETMAIGEMVDMLGDRSFGWSILLFALVNMIPVPPGGNMITSIPLLLVTAQMALGYQQVWLPQLITRRRISRKGFQRMVLKLGPVIRPVERMMRPRLPMMFSPAAERALGLFLLLVAFALFMPIPLSGYLPATAILVSGIGLVERDGLVTLAGVALGVVAIAVVATIGVMIVAGVERLAL
jgi:hypothetical protein